MTSDDRRAESAATAADDSFVAIDLGASSGRVFRGRFADEQFDLEPVHRFDNEMVRDGDTLRWPLRDLIAEILSALAWIARGGASVQSVGVDTWGVDYGLYDSGGGLIEDPVAYRDVRTQASFEQVLALVPREEIHRATGIQLMPINTLFQLHAHVHGGSWPPAAARLLPMPDVFHRYLCGSDRAEYTHATTTQLLRLDTRDWDRELCRRLRIPASILPPIVDPGTRLGPLREDLARDVGLARCEVVATATHDTASAVAGTPLSDGVAFISSGTWSLVGVELRGPIVDSETLRENFTNEGGAEGTIRFQKNVTGMWILEGCRRSWKADGRELSWDEIERLVARAPAWGGVIAPDDPRFFNPPDMAAAVRSFLRETQQPAPEQPGALARIVLESLALRYADVLAAIARLTGRRIEAVRIVGGGSRHDFLNQATAEVTGLEVLAGPVEATAIGNLAIQAIAAGRFRDLAEARAYVARMLPARRFVPRDARGAAALLARFRRIGALAAGAR